MATHPEGSRSIALSPAAHQLAEQFCQRQIDYAKAEQVYLNTLAVYAVKEYLQQQGIETEWEASDSWDAVMQAFLDVGDLVVKPYGKLECRPVAPDEDQVYVPLEVWRDRIGFVSVQFDESLTSAQLLGFVREIESETVSLSQFQPVAELLNYLKSLGAIEAAIPTTHLSQWLQQIVDETWQKVEDYFKPLFSAQQPAYQFRHDSSITCSPEQTSPVVEYRKLLSFNTLVIPLQVALVIGLLPISEAEVEIWIQLRPDSGHSHLPPNLRIAILDETGIEMMHAEARNTEVIQLQFSGEPGEPFSINIVLDEINLTEAFII
jgi:hypothetical protein